MRSFVLILVVSNLVLSAQSLYASGNQGQDPSKNREASPVLGVQQERNPDKEKPQTQSRPLPSSIPAAEPVVSVPKSQHNKDESDKQAPWWWNANSPGWAQVLVAIVGLYIIWRTLKAVERQAEANKLTAEALVQAERAYVFAKVELAEPIIPTHEGTGVSIVRALFINHGKRQPLSCI